LTIRPPESDSKADHIAIERATEKRRKSQRFQRLKAIQVAMEAVLDMPRETGSIESVTTLAAMLSWSRSQTQELRRQQGGVVVLKPGGPSRSDNNRVRARPCPAIRTSS
jgi:hypothetical protein